MRRPPRSKRLSLSLSVSVSLSVSLFISYLLSEQLAFTTKDCTYHLKSVTRSSRLTD